MCTHNQPKVSKGANLFCLRLLRGNRTRQYRRGGKHRRVHSNTCPPPSVIVFHRRFESLRNLPMLPGGIGRTLLEMQGK